MCLSAQSPRNAWSILTDSDAVCFFYIGYYILVYLQGYFLHCINTRQQEMLCHSLFLSGKASFVERNGAYAKQWQK